MIPVHSSLWKVASMDVEAWGYQQKAMPRPDWLPPAARKNAIVVNPEGTDLVVYTWESEGSPFPYKATAFVGRANKPLWQEMWQSESERQKYIDRTAESRRRLMERKQKNLEERRNFVHDLKVGDILYASWGYDQTNIDFYEVVEASAKEVIVRKVAKNQVSTTGYSNDVVAVPGKYVGPELRRRPAPGGRVKIDSSRYAQKWSGRPLSETDTMFGH